MKTPEKEWLFHAIVAQLVERHLAKVEIAGSSPVYRFFIAAETNKMGVPLFFVPCG